MRRADFEILVDEALEDLPDWVTGAVDNLHVVVEEWPSPEQDPDGTGLLGLYEGVNLHDRSSGYSGFLPDRITVFMGPHLELRLPPARLRLESDGQNVVALLYSDDPREAQGFGVSVARPVTLFFPARVEDQAESREDGEQDERQQPSANAREGKPS